MGTSAGVGVSRSRDCRGACTREYTMDMTVLFGRTVVDKSRIDGDGTLSKMVSRPRQGEDTALGAQAGSSSPVSIERPYQESPSVLATESWPGFYRGAGSAVLRSHKRTTGVKGSCALDLVHKSV